MLMNCLVGGLLVGLGVAHWRLRRALRARDRAVAELQHRSQAEQQRSAALEAGSLGVWESPLSSGELLGDSRVWALLGLDEGRHTVADWDKMVVPADRTAVQQARERLAQGAQRVKVVFRIQRARDGALRQLEMAASAWPSGQAAAVKVVGTLRDVSGHHGTERDLGERVKELRLLHRAASLTQSERRLGREVLEELVAGIPPAWLFPECCVARIRYAELEVVSPGWQETPWMQSAVFHTSSGQGRLEVAYLEERPPAVEGPFLKEERELLNSLADMLASYWERDLIERQRTSLQSQLHHAQKMDALGTLAGGIAHDFNNILAAICGNVELALVDASKESPEYDCLEEIGKASARATDLVRQILLFSRRQETKREVIPLQPVIEEAVRLLRASLPAKIEISTRISLDAPQVLADSTQIHQILMNLGTNAGHAMSARGGVLTITVDQVSIGNVVTAPSADLQAGPHARISVADSGTGISAEVMERLFEPFFTTKGQQGTGLGLSVVHGILQLHGGAITVASQLGSGSTFTLYLPAVSPASSAPDGNGDGLLVLGKGEHVLYVDDEEPLVFLMMKLLKRLGYRCTGYSEPEAALQAFRAAPLTFDAVITNDSMPRMSGLELAHAIAEIRPGTPVALVSGSSGQAGPQIDATIRSQLSKPSSLQDLSRVLQQLLAP